MSNSKRKCGGCGDRFRPKQEFPGISAWCSPDCALTVAKKRAPAGKAKIDKHVRAVNKQDKERLKTRQKWVDDAQRLMNRIVVIEDKPKGCISCFSGNEVTECGHYFHRGTKYRVSPLTLLRENLNGQCHQCNSKEDGRPHDYMTGFIDRYGKKAFDDLAEYRLSVDRREIPALTIDECKKLIISYKARLKELKAA